MFIVGILFSSRLEKIKDEHSFYMKTPAKYEQVLADFVITSQILGALKTNPQIPFNDIEVSTTNGYVTLNGDLEMEFQYEIAESTAENTTGVKEVNNLISVNTLPGKVCFWSYSTN